MIIAVALFVDLVLLGLYVWQQNQDAKLVCKLLMHIDNLQADSKALMEALARKSGQPLIFKPPEVKPSEGWFDAKPTVTISSTEAKQ
jgi:hypothetical protein